MVLWAWLLLILVAGIGMANIARGVLALLVLPVVGEVTSLPFALLGPVYIGWGVAFLACGILVLWRPNRARRWIRWAAVVYQASIWLIHILGDVSTYARGLWLRDLILSLLFLLVVFILTGLSYPLRRRRSRRDGSGVS